MGDDHLQEAGGGVPDASWQYLVPQQRVDCCRLPVARTTKKCHLNCAMNDEPVYFASYRPTFMWSLARTSLIPATF